MDVYLVGGAIRDNLLGLDVRERDWVVVGATPKEMLSLGFKPIGKDFPVFLHPTTHEEYALARTERKVGIGYHGFVFYTGIDVTLEDDLKRRDLTINAIAQDANGRLIDPYGGQRDIQNKILRHVSPAFIEDPLRVLRLCRIATMLSDFTVADETMELLGSIVKRGELKSLVAERVFKEIKRSFESRSPWLFFNILEKCGGLEDVLYEFRDKCDLKLDRHIQKICSITDNISIRFAVFCSVLNPEELITLSRRLLVPSHYYQLSLLSITYGNICQDIEQASPRTCLRLLQKTDALRRPLRFLQLLVICWAMDTKGENFASYRPRMVLEKALKVCQAIGIDQVENIQQLKGKDIGLALERLRLEVLIKLWTSLGLPH